MPSHEETDLLLYFHHNSYYSQKVIMTLHEKNINFKTHLVNLASNEQYNSWFLKVNPLGEVPVLVDGVKIIPDSTRIIQYVEDNFSNGYKRLLPAATEERIDAMNLRDDIDCLPVALITKGAPFHPEYLLHPKRPFLPSNRATMIDALSRRSQVLHRAVDANPEISDVLIHKTNREDMFCEELRNVHKYKQALDKVDEIMNKVEAILIENNKENPKDVATLFPPHFTMADVSLSILLARLDALGLAHRYWSPTSLRPLIYTYYTQVKQRESFRLSVPQYGTRSDSGLWYLVSGISVLFLLSAVYFFRRRK